MEAVGFATGSAGTAAVDLVVIGASAGGVEALRLVVAGLPRDFPASVAVVLHIPAHAPSALATILDRAGPLPAVTARDGDRLDPGVVYVAPANRHLLIDDGRLRLVTGPAENGHCPAIDPLFRSAALARGPSTIGVVLSGTRDDGSAGLVAIAQHGGVAVVQDPADALFRVMPASALDQVPAALCRAAAEIGPLLADLVAGGDRRIAARNTPFVSAVSQGADGRLGDDRPPGAGRSPDVDGPLDVDGGPGSSDLSCPRCAGALFVVPGTAAPYFRCRLGHVWSPAGLDESRRDAVDEALRTAADSLQQRAAVQHLLAAQARAHGRDHRAEQHDTWARTCARQAAGVAALLADPGGAVGDSRRAGRQGDVG